MSTPPVAEPVSGAELLRRAEGLRGRIRAQQDEAEAQGHYGPELHEDLLAAGFYHLLTPRRYGGLEVDLNTYYRVLAEIARGDPSTAWCYCLSHGHNLTTASHWPAVAQDEVFRADPRYYRASHSVAGAGTARPVPGGYVVSARSTYQSGVAYSTHVTVNAVLEGSDPPAILAVILPIGQVQVLDDWGGGATLGLGASASNTVVVDEVEVPGHMAVPFDWVDHEYLGPTPGTELHGNPMYLGVVAGFFHAELAAVMVGAARAAIDEYEHIITTRTMLTPPFSSRSEDPHHLADLGMAMTMADAAEAIVQQSATLFHEWAAEAVAGTRPFTVEMDTRLFGMLQRSEELATDAVELLFRSAGSTAAKAGQPMQRYFRDAAMLRGHVSAQYRRVAQNLAEIHFGRRTSPF